MLVMARPWVAHICSSLASLSLELSRETGPTTPLHTARDWVDEDIVAL